MIAAWRVRWVFGDVVVAGLGIIGFGIGVRRTGRFR